MFKKFASQLTWFVIVGSSAAATHWAVAVSCVAYLQFKPLVANIIGWLVAFGVSFSGHYLLTFKHQHAPLLRAGVRFFLVSALGFGVNEASYALLLYYSSLPYDLLLALVLIGIAALTFILSRFWAFRRSH